MLYVKDVEGTYHVASLEQIEEHGLKMARLRKGTSATISSGSMLMTHLGLAMRSLPTEQVRIVLLDSQNKIKKEAIVSEGLEDEAAIYPRKIARMAMENYATRVIVVHNHPTGQIRPSNADINITRKIWAALDTLDILLLDHVIIGTDHNGYFSFRENQML